MENRQKRRVKTFPKSMYFLTSIIWYVKLKGRTKGKFPRFEVVGIG